MARVSVVGVSLVAAGLLAACSGAGGGSAGDSPATTTTPSIAPSLRVPEPLNVDGLVADPCTGLSDEQAREIGLRTPGVVTDGAAGPSCRFESLAHDANKIFIAPLSTVDTGISGVYANRENDKYFEPVTVEGYPAVFAGAADIRARGTCALWVGVTDQLTVGVNSSIVTGPNVTNPCPIVQDVATEMVRHLKTR